MTPQSGNWWVSDHPTAPQRHPQRSVSTAECWSRGTSGHSDSTSSPSDARRHSRRRDGPPELGIPPTWSVCSCLRRSPGLVDQQHPAKAGPGKTDERRGVQTVSGADLGKADLKVGFIASFTFRRTIKIPKIVVYPSTEVGFQKLQRQA